MNIRTSIIGALAVAAALASGMAQARGGDEVQWSVTLSDALGKKRIAAAMEALRTDPPQSLGESRVHRVLDLLSGEERAVVGSTKPLRYPRSNVLVFYAEDGARLTVRPSGTEPKVKFYLFTFVPPEQLHLLDETRREMDERLAKMEADLRAYANAT